MSPVFWIAGAPLLGAGALFALANRAPVEIDLWPLAGRVALPLFVALIGALYLGFALGLVVAWWAGRQTRRAGRAARRQAVSLAAETAQLQRRLDHAGTPSAQAVTPRAVAP
jgi:uncharacterized integral membrane protein